MLSEKDNEKLRLINQQLKANYQSQSTSLQNLKETSSEAKNGKDWGPGPDLYYIRIAEVRKRLNSQLQEVCVVKAGLRMGRNGALKSGMANLQKSWIAWFSWTVLTWGNNPPSLLKSSIPPALRLQMLQKPLLCKIRNIPLEYFPTSLSSYTAII